MLQEEVTQENRVKIADPGPALTFVFTALTICFWGIYQGIFEGPTTLVVGVTQLACAVPYTVGAIMYFKRGETLNANVFLIFAAVFGTIGGSLNLTLGLAEIHDVVLSTQMGALPTLWSGLIMIPIVITGRGASKTRFINNCCVVLFLIGQGLVSLKVIPASISNPVITWLMFIVAVTGIYDAINDLLKYGGAKKLLPEGKPFFNT